MGGSDVEGTECGPVSQFDQDGHRLPKAASDGSPAIMTGHESSVLRRQLNPNRLTRLNNERCPYCFCDLNGLVLQDVDHVIGRRFVPSGAVSGSWNLLVRACRKCNGEKAALENDISSITIHQLVLGARSAEDLGGDCAALLAEMRRKGRARSSVTNRFVAESETRETIGGRLGAVALRFTLNGPPQLHPDRVLKLASMHTRGLSLLVFKRDEEDRPEYLPPIFLLCAEAGWSDWGNERARAFMEIVRTWPSRLELNGPANGFFRAMVRKEPGLRPIWAWALEWNRQYRTMGFMGDIEADLVELSDKLPGDTWTGEHTYDDSRLGQVTERWRKEVSLSADEDTLFEGNWPEAAPAGAQR